MSTSELALRNISFLMYHNTLRRFNETPKWFRTYKIYPRLFVDKHQTCKRGTLFAQEKNSLDLRASQAGRHGTWLFGPKISVSGLEVLGGENIVNGVYAKLFWTADFAPLVLNIALEVHYGQLWGGFWPTRTQWIELQIAWSKVLSYIYKFPEFGELSLLLSWSC